MAWTPALLLRVKSRAPRDPLPSEMAYTSTQHCTEYQSTIAHPERGWTASSNTELKRGYCLSFASMSRYGEPSAFSSPSRQLQAHHTTPATPDRHQLQSVGTHTPHEPSIFCHRCLTNQRIHLELLSAYDDESSSSSYASSSTLPLGSYEAYKADLDARYPIVCEKCRPAVEGKIKERDDVARRWIWRKWMERGRESEGAGGVPQSMGWKAPSGAVRGRGLDYERRRKRKRKQLKMLNAAIRWTLIAMGPLHTLSFHTMTSQSHQISLLLDRTLPSGWPVATLNRYAWPLAGLANVTVGMQAYSEEGCEDNQGAETGRRPTKRFTIRALHYLTYCQIIDTQLGEAWAHYAPANPVLERIPASAFACVCLALQVILLLLYLSRHPGSRRLTYTQRATETNQADQTRDVFDSLSHSLSQVTDSISAGSPGLHGGNEEGGAVFGQTTWASTNERSIPPAWPNEHPLQASLPRRDEAMELDAPIGAAQGTSMDWQPTPPPENIAAHQMQHRSPPPSPTPASRSSVFGPQKFYVPEEPIGGLEESFSRGLSLGANSGEQPDVNMQAALAKRSRKVQGAVLVAVLGLGIGVLTVVWHKQQGGSSGHGRLYETGRNMYSSFLEWLQSRWIALSDAHHTM